MRVCVDLQNRQRGETDCRKRVDRKKRGLRDAFYVAQILRRCRSLSNERNKRKRIPRLPRRN